MNNVLIDGFINFCEETIIPEHGIALEVKLTKEERDNLPDSDFGLPKERKYPLIITPKEKRASNDKDGASHIRNAIAFFHFCKEKDRKELASNIMKAIKEHKLDIEIDEKNIIRKYVEVLV